MNRQSNAYTLIYAIALVLIVGVVLSVVYQALRPQQLENIANDTKTQILAAALITPEKGQNVSDLYKDHIIDSFVVNSNGEKLENAPAAFDVNVGTEVKKPDSERLLPVFVCAIDPKDPSPASLKYILPAYGAGLWGPIWGYVAFNADGRTIYGAFFGHQGETPGLGAEITKPAFTDQFKGKSVYSGDQFTSIAVIKTGKEPSDADYVHAISGGTITSQGVQAMLFNSLEPYNAFLLSLQQTSKN